MISHAIQALFTFRLATLSRSVSSIENLDSGSCYELLRVGLHKHFKSFLMRQMFGHCSLKHRSLISPKVVFLHPLRLSNSTVVGEVGHDFPSLPPMSSLTHLFAFILS